MVRIKNPDEIRDMVKNHPMDQRRVFSIAAHIDHGKTTTSDYLLRRAGLMSDHDAGTKLMTDSDEEEQERGITIFTSVVLLSYDYHDKSYLFEINDTPGHISFTGEVSRALRGSDGAIILVDALEGLMTQTITNIQLSVGSEMCKPVLFINKVDRLISELKLPPTKVFEKIDTIITQVNEQIKKFAPPEFAKKWQVSFAKNSVAVGSAKDGWAFTMEILKQAGHTNPSIVFEKYAEDDKEWLRDNLHLEDALLRMVIEHLPNPAEAQKYKIAHIWSGDLDSDAGQALVNCDPNGPLLGMITKVFIDPKSKRPTLIGRIFSGTIRAGQDLELIGQKRKVPIKRLGVMEITDILDCDEIPAGNLFAVFGFIAPSGESFREPGTDYPGFEEISYAAEPVVSRAIEAIDPQEIAKLGDVVSKWIMADPTATFRHDKESDKYVLSGIDPLQIEILTKRINEQVKIRINEPIIVYRERISQRGQEVHAKSPNGHNRLRLYIEPLEDKVAKLIKSGAVNMDNMTDRERGSALRDKAGWDAKFARKIWDIEGQNMIIDASSGVQRMDRIKQYVIQIFRDFTYSSTVAKEPTLGLKCVITDASIHTDPAHTGFSEVLGMTNAALNISFLTANPHVYEPMLSVDIKTPKEYMGAVMGLVSQHRGRVENTVDEGEQVRVVGVLPTAETLGDFADKIRSATSGRSFWGYQFKAFEPLPKSMEIDIIKEIRKRKGLNEEIPVPDNWSRFVYKRQ